MQEFIGSSVCKGAAYGKVLVYEGLKSKTDKIKDSASFFSEEKEIYKLNKAIEEAKSDYENLSSLSMDIKAGEVFSSYNIILSDEEYIGAILSLIKGEHIFAYDAVERATLDVLEPLMNADSDYIKERADDVKAVSDKLKSLINGETEAVQKLIDPVILVAKNINPEELMLLDPANILALVLINGSAISHTAVLAKEYGVPLLVDTDMTVDDVVDGMFCYVNSYTGHFYADIPIEMEDSILKEIEDINISMRYAAKESYRRLGNLVKLYANVGSLYEHELGKLKNINGVGLFRTEFLYMNRVKAPSEALQLEVYSKALKAMAGKEVVFRTFDLGGDKNTKVIKTFDDNRVELRGINLYLNNMDAFKTQLTALLKASEYGNLSIMYPMINSVDEVDTLNDVLDTVISDLLSTGISIKRPRVGVMIETKNAVKNSKELAEAVDFFSIGTNDLSSDILNLNRYKDAGASMDKSELEPVLAAIKTVTENAKKAGISTCICGEMASDTRFFDFYKMIGIDSLSIAPSQLY